MTSETQTDINSITDEDIVTFNVYPDLDRYQGIALKSAIYPGQGTALGLVYTALKMNGEAGEFAEHVGKAMRDDNFSDEPLTIDRRAALLKELGDELWYIAAAAKELGATLSDVALINLEKLCDRSKRNKLQGSGDDR